MASKSSAKTASKTSSKTAGKPTTKSAAKSTAKLTAARKAPSAKAAPAKATTKPAVKPTIRTLPKTTPAKPALSVVTDGQTTAPGQELKKRELLDQIVKRTDVKKKFAKPVMEAMIEVLGEALAQDRPLNLQPMGKVMPKRTKESGSNRVITARIRQSKTAQAGKSDTARGLPKPPVAKPAE